MNRIGRSGLVLAALVAAGVGGYGAGQRGIALPPLPWLPIHGLSGAATARAAPAPTGPIVYYRDPDGRPAYAEAPGKNADGQDLVAVHASEDVSFDAPPPPIMAEQSPPALAGEGPKTIRFYRNPMGLPDTSPVPKKDSMGMDYIPVFAGDEPEGSTIKLSPGKLQRTGVRSEAAAMRVLTTPIRASGTVQVDERRKSVISLRFDAYIDKVEDITTGTMVRQGQPLMRVYGPDLLAPAAQFLSALGERADAQSLKSARRRLENYAVPDAVMAQIERSREIPATLVWPSPRSGIVIERTAVDGMKATAGDALFRLADISTVWVVADIAEADLPSIAIGQAVSVKPRGADRIFTGRVALVYPSINKDTRTARLRVELPNPDAALLPDMYADVEIETGSGTPVLTVPETAVIDSGDRTIVILDKGDGQFEPRPVHTGRHGSGLVEVRDGLAEGDRVVTSATFLIDAESNLKVALQGLAAPGDGK